MLELAGLESEYSEWVLLGIPNQHPKSLGSFWLVKDGGGERCVHLRMFYLYMFVSFPEQLINRNHILSRVRSEMVFVKYVFFSNNNLRYIFDVEWRVRCFF